MKVELNSAVSTQLPGETSVKPAANTHVQTAQPETSDRTTLKADQTVQALATRALQLPEARQAAVSNLRESVTSGTYETDASKTARAIISQQS